ncbi:MAG: aconitase X [Acidimicrobiia bacterium]
MYLELSERDRSLLAGDLGEAQQLAMELLIAVGEADGAHHLIDIEAAHIDGCSYHGQAGVDFAHELVEGGGEVQVPTTLNVSSLDLLHPDLYKGDPALAESAKGLMDLYVALGCSPTWTCAPYQLHDRPSFGQQIAWGESNAIVFANSVLGARTNRYGDFMDICCALTGRAPYAGLHTDAGRLATTQFNVVLPDSILDDDLAYPLLGHVLGQLAGNRVSVITGLDERADEDRLKALGAAAASSGAVAMFHAVGVTPEAATLSEALGDTPAHHVVELSLDTLRDARRELTTAIGTLGAVSVGTPHMSLEELGSLAVLVDGRKATVPFYVSTSRDVLSEAETAGVMTPIEAFGVIVVADTCTYITPIMGDIEGDVMTNSAKWAYYAPANLGVSVVIGSLADCVESAVTGSAVTTGEW